jgi:hypothetical protein
MAEYSFHIRKKTQPVTQDKNTKEIILSQYDHFTQMKQSDEKMNYLHGSLDKISHEITETFSLLQQTSDKEKIRSLSDKLSHLTVLHKKMETDYDGILQKELSVLYQNWPEIFEKVKEGIDRETLEHVLTMFEKFQSGQISANQAVMGGMDYMTQKYNLPNDFFNKNAVDHFNKNMHKLS